MNTPEKCINCEHAFVQFEQVHDGWGIYHLDYVVRCDCFPVHYIVGCSCAEMYCEKNHSGKEDLQ